VEAAEVGAFARRREAVERGAAAVKADRPRRAGWPAARFSPRGTTPWGARRRRSGAGLREEFEAANQARAAAEAEARSAEVAAALSRDAV
jgi:hypothetical protein